MLINNIFNDDKSCIIGFRTIYLDNKHIDKIEVIEYDDIAGEDNCKISVYFTNGNISFFFQNISIIWSGQFGINISPDGTKLYIPNDRKGLQCHKSLNGEIIWKTRLTSAGAICINKNDTITCITSTNLIILDENGKKINSQKILHYSGRKISNSIISAQTSEERIAIFESETLKKVAFYSLKELGLIYYSGAKIYNNELYILGKSSNPKEESPVKVKVDFKIL